MTNQNTGLDVLKRDINGDKLESLSDNIATGLRLLNTYALSIALA